MSDAPKITARERMGIERVQMPEREGALRSTDFAEVNLGLPEKIAIREAQRCLQCKKAACMEGCPVGIDIPGFITLIANGDIMGAAAKIRQDNNLPAVTGRVCPQETQCECLCVRCKSGASVAIGWLERFVADYELAHRNGQKPVTPIVRTGKKVACVGSGPAGISCAGELAKLGYDVTIFEAFHKLGGVLVYGIPEFRLPKAIVSAEIENLKALGVKCETNVLVGRTVTIEQLLKEEGFAAIFIANGAGLPVFMNVPGENLNGVYSANEYLTRVNLMGAYRFPEYATPVIRGQRVCVIGGGNVAMDAVRTAKRLGAKEAIIVYRRSRTEMPARVEEVHHAEQEGIKFEMLTAPTEVLGEGGWVKGLQCVRMELGEPDASGRRRPVTIPGSDFTIDCDLVIVAVGTRANPLLTQTTPNLKVNKWGYIEADENLMTSLPGVFAGGDIVRGAATVILAMGDGKKAAHKMDAWLKQHS